MDPLSQATLGAACAQSTQPARLGWVTLFGAVAGLAPDLDVLIGSDSDPLLFLEYHRQFSHSLVFIPLGALIVTLLLFRLPKQPLSFAEAYLASSAAYASHGLLDACTSYGTQLLWPFSDARLNWDLISVIDPLFTLPLLAAAVLACRYEHRRFAAAGLCWALGYLAVGYWQQLRVAAATSALAEERGHLPQGVLVKPAFGNLLLWKSVYLSDGRFHVDGHRAAARIAHCGGEHIAALELTRDFERLPPEHQQARDIERFRWFSQGYLAPLDTPQRSLIVDVRYANLPHRIEPLWGIVVDPDAAPQQHVSWWSDRQLSKQQRVEFIDLLTGRGCDSAGRPVAGTRPQGDSPRSRR